MKRWTTRGSEIQREEEISRKIFRKNMTTNKRINSVHKISQQYWGAIIRKLGKLLCKTKRKRKYKWENLAQNGEEK